MCGFFLGEVALYLVYCNYLKLTLRQLCVNSWIMLYFLWLLIKFENVVVKESNKIKWCWNFSDCFGHEVGGIMVLSPLQIPQLEINYARVQKFEHTWSFPKDKKERYRCHFPFIIHLPPLFPNGSGGSLSQLRGGSPRTNHQCSSSSSCRANVHWGRQRCSCLDSQGQFKVTHLPNPTCMSLDWDKARENPRRHGENMQTPHGSRNLTVRRMCWHCATIHEEASRSSYTHRITSSCTTFHGYNTLCSTSFPYLVWFLSDVHDSQFQQFEFRFCSQRPFKQYDKEHTMILITTLPKAVHEYMIFKMMWLI